MVIRLKGKTVLLIVSGIGLLATCYLTARNTPEAQKRKEEALKEKRERLGDENAKLTPIESIKAQIGAYAPAIVSGMVTVGGIVGSEVINKENLKKAEKAFSDYKDMAENISGKGTVKTIEKAVEQKKLDDKKGKPWQQKETFRIVFQGKSIHFESTRAEVIEAIYELNRYFHGRGVVTFNEFLSFLGQPPAGKEGDDRGWEIYVGESIYGYTWIDIGLKECEDEPWVTELYMPVYPHFFEENECRMELDDGCRKLESGWSNPSD